MINVKYLWALSKKIVRKLKRIRQRSIDNTINLYVYKWIVWVTNTDFIDTDKGFPLIPFQLSPQFEERSGLLTLLIGTLPGLDEGHYVMVDGKGWHRSELSLLEKTSMDIFLDIYDGDLDRLEERGECLNTILKLEQLLEDDYLYDAETVY